MLHCTSCNVDYSGSLKRCPLCGQGLTGTPEQAVFPHRRITRTWRISLKLVELFSGAGAIALVILWGCGVLSFNVAALSLLAIALNFVFVYNMLRLYPGFIKSSSRYIFVLLAVGFLLYWFTGLSWVTDFAIPIVCLVALGFDAILCLCLKGSFVEQCAKYLVFDILCGFLPLLCLGLGWASFTVLAWISAGIATLLFLVLVIFFRQDFFGEFKKLSST